jgi:type IV secretion system protein VirB9
MRRFLFACALIAPAAGLARPPAHNENKIAMAIGAARIARQAIAGQGAPAASIPMTRRAVGASESSAHLFDYAPGGLYLVHAAVGRVTDIVLQPGETLSDTGAVAAGDTVRWVIGEAASGNGSSRRTHILVKPTDPGLTTNLVINTDRRTYHVELRSSPSTYMASVGWSYPQDELIALRARAQAAQNLAATQVQAGVDPSRLNFAYRLSGDSPPWRPAHVFDDGARTYIVFPEAIGQSELPPLFLIGERGEAELINYRISGRHMIVDRLFARAELRLGTRRQKIVRIDQMGAGGPKS